MKTKVKFLFNEREKDLYAFFPEEDFDVEGKYKMSYSHIGQHTACDPKYTKQSRQATKEEYTPLLEELKSIGYNLEILNK